MTIPLGQVVDPANLCYSLKKTQGNSMANHEAQLTFGSKTANFPLRSGTLGNDVIETKTLGDHDVYSLDPGFYSTASCESKITFIDGNEGILLHRGYPIEQLAETCDYMEACYLLLDGELPTRAQKDAFVNSIKQHSLTHEQMRNFFNGFRRDAHPMAVMVGVVGALSAFYHDRLDYKKEENQNMFAIRLIAKMPTIAAMCYKYSIGEPFMSPNPKLGYAENYLHMLYSRPYADEAPNPVLVKAMDTIFTLHADHEQNASTSTVRMAGSTGANPFACIASGIAALWGPAHGGANEAALNMLKEIGDETSINKYIKRAKDPKDTFRLMGFGHRVYKNYDPRAKIMRQTCHDVLEAVGKKDDQLFRLAMKLEKIALEDAYFVEKKLYPNVDFYSGITQSAIGIPDNMFTVIFALARTVGWISNWVEMIRDPSQRLCRPRQLYIGEKKRDVVTLNDR